MKSPWIGAARAVSEKVGSTVCLAWDRLETEGPSDYGSESATWKSMHGVLAIETCGTGNFSAHPLWNGDGEETRE